MRIRHFKLQGAQVQFLARELRSHMTCVFVWTIRKNKGKREKELHQVWLSGMWGKIFVQTLLIKIRSVIAFLESNCVCVCVCVCVWCPGLVALWHMASFWTRNQTCISCIGRWILYHWTTREALESNLTKSNKIKIHMLLDSNPNVKILTYRNKCSKKKIAKWWPIHGAPLGHFSISILFRLLCCVIYYPNVVT